MAKITIAKTRRVDPEFGVGESYDPKTDVSRETRFEQGPGERWSSSLWNRLNYDYPFAEEMRQREAFRNQYPEGTQFMEATPPTFRNDLAALIGQGAADTAVDWTPAAGLDWFDRMNWATMSGNKGSIGETASEIPIGWGIGAAAERYGLPLLKRGYNLLRGK